jgi:hypothetical protein
MSSKGKRVVFLAILLIAFFPIPIHTTTFPFSSIGHDYVSKYLAGAEGCEAIEERWAGLLIGIQTNRITGTGDFDCVEWQKGWGIDTRCRLDGLGVNWIREPDYDPEMDFLPPMSIWSIPAGENAIVVSFGLIPLQTWYMDTVGFSLLTVRLASSGFGIDPIGPYHYPNLLIFGDCDNQLQ